MKGLISLDESTLVDRAKQGDMNALEKLLYNNYNIVFGYLMKLCSNEDTAKDITQETMVKAISNI